MAASSFSEIMKENVNKLAGKAKEEPPILSTEDQEIKQLEDRRKELRGGKEKKVTHRESRVYRAEQNCEK